MTKAILLSVRPQHALNILYKTKTLELRKRIPKGFKGWVYVYVTKAKPFLNCWYGKCHLVYDYTYKELVDDNSIPLNGKVIARFWFDEYDKYVDATNCYMTSCGMQCDNEYMYQLCELQDEIKNTCLTCDEIEAYGKGKDLYAWHIKKLEVLKPMQLSEFYVHSKDFYTADKYDYENEELINYVRVTKSPQSFQYVYVEEN
jgi:hypothetical protein